LLPEQILEDFYYCLFLSSVSPNGRVESHYLPIKHVYSIKRVPASNLYWGMPGTTQIDWAWENVRGPHKYPQYTTRAVACPSLHYSVPVPAGYAGGYPATSGFGCISKIEYGTSLLFTRCSLSVERMASTCLCWIELRGF